MDSQDRQDALSWAHLDSATREKISMAPVAVRKIRCHDFRVRENTRQRVFCRLEPGVPLRSTPGYLTGRPYGASCIRQRSQDAPEHGEPQR